MTHVDQSIHRIRAFVRESGWSRFKLVKKAGLSVNSLAELDCDSWNPTANTLRAVEQVILADFDPTPTGDFSHG